MKGLAKQVTKHAVKVQASTNYSLARICELSTWIGLFTIGAGLATGDAAAWLNPQKLPIASASIDLIVAKEGGA